MALYMIQFAYTPEAWAALTKQPQDRSTLIRQMAEKLGGRLVGMYYCFGEYDGVVLFEAPNDISAAASSLAATSAGHIKAIRTTRLYSVEEMMEAMRLAGGAPISPPSRG
jgi:uncharacterized protein with GYD domain